MHAGAGLLRNDRSLRPVWFSVATMIRQLQGFNGRALRLPSDDPTVWMYLWEDGPRKLITAWRYAGTSRRTRRGMASPTWEWGKARRRRSSPWPAPNAPSNPPPTKILRLLSKRRQK
jgi:hypothetical protein